VNPSEVRSRVLADHDWLRIKLSMLETCATAVKDGQASRAKPLRERLEDFCRALLMHLATEDDILVPMLGDLDAWGEVRVERMSSDHQAQRAEISRLCRAAATAAPVALAESILTFARALREDMAHEERVELSEDLLRDDTVSIAQADG
jgi:iron-sulfur cluster repair protein YtfE (RIC family)